MPTPRRLGRSVTAGRSVASNEPEHGDATVTVRSRRVVRGVPLRRRASHGAVRCHRGASVNGCVAPRTVRRKTVPRGSDSVWIFPICSAHNNDDIVSMQGLRYLTGVWLRNYLGS